MSRAKLAQNSLITGVISPTLLGRVDLKKYYNAVEEAENMVIMPHGGMERRPGLKYLTSVATGSRLFSFEFSISQNYVFVMSITNFKVYLPNDDTLQATVSWSTALTQTQIDDMDIIQSADTIIITHEDFNPITIQRAGSDTSWTLADMVLLNIPKFDYDTTKVPTYFNYGDSLTYDIQIGEILYNENGDETKGLNGYLYQALTAQTSIDISNENLYSLTNWECIGLRPNVWGATAEDADYTNTGATSVVTVQVGEHVVNSDGNGVDGLDGHIYRAVTLRTSIDLSTENYTSGVNWLDIGTYYNIDKGWPRTCTFHQGRLVFGGSLSKPTSVWGSVVNDPYNFDTGGGNVLADDAIFDILDTDQFNAIQNVVSARNLQVMTAGGEFINTADVFTPETSAWTRSTSYGSSRIKPVTLDGATYFMDRFKKTVRGFIYSFEDGGYTTPPISILADHIIEDVTDLDMVRGSSTSVSNLLYLINGDGTAAVFNTMRKEDISGWTKWTTSGTFKRVTVTADTVTFIVARDGTEYLEVLDSSVLLDHSFSTTSAIKVEVDALLLSSEIRVVADSVTQTTTAAVDEGGTYYAYSDHTATALYAGLNYTVRIKTLPAALTTKAEGNIVHERKRVTKATLNLYNSRGVYVNDILVTTRKFGDATDEVLAPFTGVVGTYLLGYNKKTQIEITQTNPDPLTLLSLELEISY